MSLLAMYLAALGFGGTLIAVSVLLGGGEHTLDPDAAVDGDAGADGADHGEAGSWLLPLLSFRFWTFGLAAFGLAGVGMSALAVPSVVGLALALALGMAAGTLSARFFSALNRDSVSGDTALARYAGEEGRVLIAIRPGQPGKIAIDTLAGRVEMLARTRDPAVIEPGSVVIVASVGPDGVADVSLLRPLDERTRNPERAPASAARPRSMEEP